MLSGDMGEDNNLNDSKILTEYFQYEARAAKLVTAIFLSTSKFISTQRSRRYSNQHAEISANNHIVFEKKKR